MSEPLIIAVPSKGRLKEQVEAWLGDCGLELQTAGGARGYLASLKGLEGAQVRLLSAGDIADALAAGEVHTGVTGEDLLHEKGNDIAARVLLLQALGFGQADLVVAVPKSWLDVESMADLEEVSHDVLYRTGRRLQVATKYPAQTRAFFARHGVADYRITESAGATEGGARSGLGRAGRRHHHYRRDARRQRPEGAGRRGDPEEPGASGRQSESVLVSRGAGNCRAATSGG